MKLLGWLVGVAAVGGLVVLAIAGVTAAVAILVTGAALFAMIALGSLLGGRSGTGRVPYPTPTVEPQARVGDEEERPEGSVG
jgi:hypothetical protein